MKVIPLESPFLVLGHHYRIEETSGGPWLLLSYVPNLSFPCSLRYVEGSQPTVILCRPWWSSLDVRAFGCVVAALFFILQRT